MNARELDELRALEDEHPWFRARRRALEPLFLRASSEAPAGPWLDVGAGTGGNLAAFACERPRIALDRSGHALALLGGRRGCRDVWRVRAGAERLPLADASVACVTALDLLEHVDDRAALDEIARVLKPGGRLLASVPRWPGLWSAHDVALGHRRRYRRSELAAELRARGLTPLASRGFVTSALPLVWLVRRCRARSPEPARTDFGALGASGRAVLSLSLGLDEVLARLLGRAALPGLSWIVACERAQERRADRIARTSSSGISAASARSERPAAIVAR